MSIWTKATEMNMYAALPRLSEAAKKRPTGTKRTINSCSVCRGSVIQPHSFHTQAHSEQKVMWMSTSETGKSKPAVERMYLLSTISVDESTIHCTSR